MPLTFVFAHNTPKNIQLGEYYKGPKKGGEAEYNSGKGWKPYPGRTIPISSGNKVSFRGDWRDENRAYEGIFEDTFKKDYPCIMLGRVDHDANNTPYGYAGFFMFCDGIVEMRDNPWPEITGTPALGMFEFACANMENITTLPEGFLDTSKLTGPPSNDLFWYVCSDMKKLRSLPKGFLDISNLSGPITNGIFTCACENMENVSDSFTFKISKDVTIADVYNAYNNFYGAWSYMYKWKGTVMWGEEVLFEKLIPTKGTFAIHRSENIPNFKKFNVNWKVL